MRNRMKMTMVLVGIAAVTLGDFPASGQTMQQQIVSKEREGLDAPEGG